MIEKIKKIEMMNMIKMIKMIQMIKMIKIMKMIDTMEMIEMEKRMKMTKIILIKSICFESEYKKQQLKTVHRYISNLLVQLLLAAKYRYIFSNFFLF